MIFPHCDVQMYNMIIFHPGSCFISNIGVFFGLFLGPIMAIVLFNFVIFVLVIRVLIKHSRRKIVDVKDSKKYKATLKTLISVMGVMLMFGLTWLFGAFTVQGASIAFQWLFVIFNSFQGFFLFVFFCVIGKDARQEWIELLSCGKKRKLNKGLPSTSKSGTFRRSRNSTKGTSETYITSRGGRSRTILRATGFNNDSFDNGSVADTKESIELGTTAASAGTVDTNLPRLVEEEETDLAVSNGLVDTTGEGSQANLIVEPKPEPEDIQVPPHVLMRFRPSVSHSAAVVDDGLSDTEKDVELTQLTIVSDLDAL